MTDRQRNGFILLLVVGLLIASAVSIVTQKTILGLDLKGRFVEADAAARVHPVGFWHRWWPMKIIIMIAFMSI